MCKQLEELPVGADTRPARLPWSTRSRAGMHRACCQGLLPTPPEHCCAPRTPPWDPGPAGAALGLPLLPPLNVQGVAILWCREGKKKKKIRQKTRICSVLTSPQSLLCCAVPRLLPPFSCCSHLHVHLPEVWLCVLLPDHCFLSAPVDAFTFNLPFWIPDPVLAAL